jgi:hypothetical protein
MAILRMQISIEIDNWPQAHYLGCILADAEWEWKSIAEGKPPEIAEALERYAAFFKSVAKQITTQASVLNT